MNWSRKHIEPWCVLVVALMLLANTAVAQYRQRNLVADRTGLGAPTIDPLLLNAWGFTACQLQSEDDAENQQSGDGDDDGSLFCVSDAFAGVATVYTQSGGKVPVTVSIPAASVPIAPFGLPTGIVFNRTRDFVISKNGKSAPALLIFATLDGAISGWNPKVDATNAVTIIDNSAETPFPASYTGLAIGKNSQGQNVIYAADSGGSLTTSNNRIDMFDGNFNSIGNFTDLNGTSGMTVYGIQNVRGKLFVSFATFTFLGGGVVDIFDTDGNLLTPSHFAVSPPAGPLEAPWGFALAPDNFGQFSNTMLIGNVDDGHINAYDPRTAQFLGQLKDTSGNLLIGTDGLWGLNFGHGEDEDSGKLFFAAGANGYADGLFGVISPAGGEGDNVDQSQKAEESPQAVQRKIGRPRP